MKVKTNPIIENSDTYSSASHERAVLIYHELAHLLAMIHYADGDDLQMAFDRIKSEPLPKKVKSRIRKLINAVIEHGIGVEE